MFCPRCASSQSDDLRFCKVCGANLYAVRQVVDTKDTTKKFDWSDTWVAEMFLSGEEAEKRKAEMERRRGLTPEVKRYNEIKAGVITSSVGFAVAIFLYNFMPGIVLGAHISPGTAEILTRVWLAGLLPIFVGFALLINGVFISKRLVDISKRAAQSDLDQLEVPPHPRELRSADTNEFTPSVFSVTEQTTKNLKSSGQK